MQRIIITTKRQINAKADILKATFFLRGFLICSLCGQKLSGSYPKGSTKRYPYYHCNSPCKTRINAILLNESYQNKLQELVLSNNAAEFSRILEDQNIKTQKTSYLHERSLIERKLKEEGLTLSQARRLFVSRVLKADDYNELKKSYTISMLN